MDAPERPLPAFRQRLDKWLFFARVAKSRTLAQTLIANGSIRVNGERVGQSAHALKAGDEVSLASDFGETRLRVLLAGERRGPYEEARKLYEDISPPRPPRASVPEQQAARARGSGRPTKRERRETDRLHWSIDDGDP